MENPATWSADAKAIDAAISKYEEQVRQGVIGHSLVRVIEDEVVAELRERIEMLNHIALSAIALKLNIESGFPPTLHALNRDLALYQARFGGVVEMIGPWPWKQKQLKDRIKKAVMTRKKIITTLPDEDDLRYEPCQRMSLIIERELDASVDPLRQSIAAVLTYDGGDIEEYMLDLCSMIALLPKE